MLLILTNDLGKLWVSFSDLLEDWFKHRRLLLDKLTKLLKMWTLSKKIHILGITCSWTTRTAASCGATSSTLLASLSSSFKQIDRLITCSLGSLSWWRRAKSGLSRLGSLLLLLLSFSLFSLNVLWNTTQKILNGTVRIEVSSAQGTVDLRSRKAHGFHLAYRGLIAISNQERRRVIET